MSLETAPLIYLAHLSPSVNNLGPLEPNPDFSDKNDNGFTLANMYASSSFHEAMMLGVILIFSKYVRIQKFFVDNRNFKPNLVLGMRQHDYLSLTNIQTPNSSISNYQHPLLAEVFYIHRYFHVQTDGWKLFTRPTGFFAQTYRTNKTLVYNNNGHTVVPVQYTLSNFSIIIEDEYGGRIPLW